MARHSAPLAPQGLATQARGRSTSDSVVGKSRKKLARRERQAKQQEKVALVAAANAESNLVGGLEKFCRLEQPGLDVNVECVRGSELAAADLAFCDQLVRADVHKGSGWPLGSKAKRRDISDPCSWVLLLRTTAPLAEADATAEDADAEAAAADRPAEEECEWVFVEHPLAESAEAPSAAAAPEPIERSLGFVHLQFCIEADRPVLYVLQLQLLPEVQDKGLGKFAMQLTEKLARKFGMASLMLTVFKKDERALDFYRDKLRYSVDETSPSRCDRQEESYEILSKSTELLPQGEGEDAVELAAAC